MHEFINLFNGINGKSGITETTFILKGTDSDISRKRTSKLNEYAKYIDKRMSKFKSGLDSDLEKKRLESKQRILKYFDATENDWYNYQWHLKNIIKDIYER